MDKRVPYPSPKLKAGLLSRITFSWMVPFMIRGYKNPNFRKEDIPDVLPKDRSKHLGEIFEAEWKKHCNECKYRNKKPSLMKVLGKLFFVKFFLNMIAIVIVECIVGILQPMSLGLLLEYLRLEEDHLHPGEWKKYLGIGGIVGTSLIYAFSFRLLMFDAHHAGVQCRLACTTSVYKKVMRLTSSALLSSDVGEIVTLLSSDLNQFDEMEVYYAYLLVAPIQLSLAIALLYFKYFGNSALIGLFLLFIYAPLQLLFGHLFTVFREKIANLTYRRVGVLAEAFNNIYVIKLYGWEPFFLRQAKKIRESELNAVHKPTILRSLNSSWSIFIPKFLIFATMFLHVHLDEAALNAEKVNVTLVLYETITFFLTMFFPMGVKNFAEFKVAIRHLEDFLLMEETEMRVPALPKSRSLMRNQTSQGSELDMEPRLDIENATFTYPFAKDGFQLKDINLHLEGPGMTMVIGNIHSGKSCLLNSIRGGTLCTQGTVTSIGEMYYCPISPWLFPGSLRENVLTGNPYKKAWYEKILNACDLEEFSNNFEDHDLAILDSANLTVAIRARICLARTIYTDGDILLLDDPFYYMDVISAMDILETCLQSVLRDKMVIMVVNKTKLLKYASNILIISSGQLVMSGGSYMDCQQGKLEIVEDENDLTVEETRVQASFINIREEFNKDHSERSSIQVVQQHTDSITRIDDDNDPQSLHLTTMSEETVFSNYIGIKIYFKYIFFGNSKLVVILCFLLFIITQMAHSTMEFAIECFAYKEETNHHKLYDNNSHATSLTNTYSNPEDYCVAFDVLGEERKNRLIFFLIIIFGMYSLAILRVVFYYIVCLRSSRSLQDTMVKCLMKVPVKFFETNPMGRILNRCSQDTGAVDESLPFVLYELLDTILMFFGGMSLLLFLNPYMVIPNIVLLLLFFLLNGFQQNTVSNLKRLEGVARSPIISAITTTVQGLETIHALHKEDLFLQTFYNALDTHTRIWYTLLAAEHWLSVIFDQLTVVYIAVVTILFVFFHANNPATVGLGVVLAIVLNKYLQLFMSNQSACDNLMIDVERILEYTTVPGEAEWKSCDEIPCPPNWPSKGEIVIKNLCYSSNAFKGVALKNVNLHIRPGQRVGIIGRTGSGKNVFLNVLLRINEQSSGSIIIDGVDVSNLTLSDYRKRISVIPSDPVIFQGTLRDNYDPLREYTDDEIWTVIKNTYLFETVSKMPEGLDTITTAYHFSHEQKLLICFGRALLKKSSVLICNISSEADSTAHKIIHDHFSQCTIIAPAHQQHNVIEFNHLVVLENGVVTDFDSPEDLEHRDEMSKRVLNDLRRLSVLNQDAMAAVAMTYQTFRQQKNQL